MDTRRFETLLLAKGVDPAVVKSLCQALSEECPWLETDDEIATEMGISLLEDAPGNVTTTLRTSSICTIRGQWPRAFPVLSRGVGKVQVGAQVTASKDGVTGGVAKGGVGAGAYVGTGNGTQTTYATPSLSQLVGAASKALENLTPSKDQK